jgi:uncharacterized protein YecE (DUF72 family)
MDAGDHRGGTSMILRVGTSGYSYKQWVGNFYPPKTPAHQMLRYYASQLGTVEINNTFYRMPTAAMVGKWAGEVPEHFRFVLKAPKRITHERKLQQADDAVRALVDASSSLGERLGPLLFQLPPFFRKNAEVLREFLDRLAPVRAAFEFRHETWFDDEVYELLRNHGAALCLADTEDGEPPLEATAAWGYLRLRRPDYDDDALAKWAERVRARPWQEAYVFFKHEDEGKGPELAARFVKIAG